MGFKSALELIQVLVKVDPGTVSNEKQNKIQPNTCFNPGTVLQKANSGTSGARRKKQPPSTGSTQEG